MKRWIRTTFVLLLGIASAGLWAESLDKVWIVPEDTGNPATLVRLDKPNFEPAQSFKLYVEKAKLTAKWNEGYATGTYTIYSQAGKKVWTSGKEIFKKQVDGDSWTLSKILDVSLPEAVAKGSWRLEITITDYHTGTAYVGNAAFTVGLEEKQAESAPAAEQTAQKATPKAAQSGPLVSVIENTDFVLTSAVRANGKITLKFKVTAHGNESSQFLIWDMPIRLIDSSGNDYSAVGANSVQSTFRANPEFIPEIPTKQEISIKVPDTLSDSLAYIEVSFNYRPDKITYKNVQLPYGAE